MNKIDRYAANLAPPSLILPEYQRFRMDGQGIGERSMAMAAKLTRLINAASGQTRSGHQNDLISIAHMAGMLQHRSC